MNQILQMLSLVKIHDPTIKSNIKNFYVTNLGTLENEGSLYPYLPAFRMVSAWIGIVIFGCQQKMVFYSRVALIGQISLI